MLGLLLSILVLLGFIPLGKNLRLVRDFARKRWPLRGSCIDKQVLLSYLCFYSEKPGKHKRNWGCAPEKEIYRIWANSIFETDNNFESKEGLYESS